MRGGAGQASTQPGPIRLASSSKNSIPAQENRVREGPFKLDPLPSLPLNNRCIKLDTVYIWLPYHLMKKKKDLVFSLIF